MYYDGPLKVRVPLEVLMDPDNNFVWDIKLPDRDEYNNSTTRCEQYHMVQSRMLRRVTGF